ncbi:hypothetical protein FHX45_000682 [Amycolatopsis granulosa]|nr:hypothetical protein [Amycolatopsis granulosa]
MPAARGIYQTYSAVLVERDVKACVWSHVD